MTAKGAEQNAYILGTDLDEMNRLGLQHQVWASEAQRGWAEAGFSKGMTLLDLGSGPGFCTRELAKITGPTGKVIAVDKSKIYLDYIKEINRIQQLSIETILEDFDSLELEPESIDGMYCRWALAWIPNPKEIMAKIYSALRPGAKVVIHEYYHWMTHQINPADPHVSKAIGMCYKSFQDAPGDIDIAKKLPTLLADIGYEITSVRPMSKMSRPHQLNWQWPRSFYEVYWPKIKEMGYLTADELEQAFENLAVIESNKDASLLCPLLAEVIGVK